MGIKASKKQILQMVEKSSIFYKPKYVDIKATEYNYKNLNKEHFHNLNNCIFNRHM